MMEVFSIILKNIHNSKTYEIHTTINGIINHLLIYVSNTENTLMVAILIKV